MVETMSRFSIILTYSRSQQYFLIQVWSDTRLMVGWCLDQVTPEQTRKEHRDPGSRPSLLRHGLRVRPRVSTAYERRERALLKEAAEAGGSNIPTARREQGADLGTVIDPESL